MVYLTTNWYRRISWSVSPQSSFYRITVTIVTSNPFHLVQNSWATGFRLCPCSILFVFNSVGTVNWGSLVVTGLIGIQWEKSFNILAVLLSRITLLGGLFSCFLCNSFNHYNVDYSTYRFKATFMSCTIYRCNRVWWYFQDYRITRFKTGVLKRYIFVKFIRKSVFTNRVFMEHRWILRYHKSDETRLNVRTWK